MDLYLAMAAPDLVVVVHLHKSTEASIFDDLQKLFLKEITISAIFTTYFSSTFSACHSQGIIDGRISRASQILLWNADRCRQFYEHQSIINLF